MDQFQTVSNSINTLDTLNHTLTRYGLRLTPLAYQSLEQHREAILSEQGRIAISAGEGLIDKLAYAFCDASELGDWDYEALLHALVESFYAVKALSNEILSDDEVISFMLERFESCGGALDGIESALPQDVSNRKSFQEECDIDGYRAECLRE